MLIFSQVIWRQNNEEFYKYNVENNKSQYGDGYLNNERAIYDKLYEDNFKKYCNYNNQDYLYNSMNNEDINNYNYHYNLYNWRKINWKSKKDKSIQATAKLFCQKSN